MKFFLSTLVTIYFLLTIHSQAQAEIELWDWGINIDGTSYCLEGPCDFDFFSIGNLTTLADLPSSINHTSFNLSDDVTVRDGMGNLIITVTGAGSHSVTVYLNYDLDFSINGTLNETGAVVGIPESGGAWEIDEIGWGNLGSTGTEGIPYIGDIFDNFVDSGTSIPPASKLDNQIFYNTLDNQYLTPAIEDTALAQSWDFDLAEGETVVIYFTAALTEPVGFYLVQNDPDSGTQIYLSSSTNHDCAGTLGGTATIDECGVCDDDPSNDNTTCMQDCEGTWGGTATEDNCGTCDDNPANNCTQDCTGTWGGAATEDNCGTCDDNPANDCIKKPFPWIMFLNIIVNGSGQVSGEREN